MSERLYDMMDWPEMSGLTENLLLKVASVIRDGLSPVLSNLALAHKQRCCLCLINCCIGRFYGRCPNPQFLKKLSKLFYFWEDNLALAKFQSPTDTPLNHNLPQLMKKNLKNNSPD